MGWIKERTKAAGHGIEKGIDSATYNIFGKGIITGREKDEKGIYIGYDSNNGISISTPYYGPNANKFTGSKYSYGNAGKSSTTAYKANTAGTANKIAQGGMTKDDILKYNTIHPNEIAGDKPANTTALNTNTAVRSK